MLIGMPPCWDVYARLPNRDRVVIEEFLNAHVADWESQGAWLLQDAQAVLAAGLGGATHQDFLITGRVVRSGARYVVLAFGEEGSTVFGYSYDVGDDEAEEALSLSRANQALLDLMREVGASEGFVACECPPPLTKTAWSQALESSEHSIVS